MEVIFQCEKLKKDKGGKRSFTQAASKIMTPRFLRGGTRRGRGHEFVSRSIYGPFWFGEGTTPPPPSLNQPSQIRRRILTGTSLPFLLPCTWNGVNGPLSLPEIGWQALPNHRDHLRFPRLGRATTRREERRDVHERASHETDRRENRIDVSN